MRKLVKFPRRERVLLRTALDGLKIRYRELVPFFSPYYGGEDGSINWLDFVCYTKNTGMFVLLFKRRVLSGLKPYEKQIDAAKVKLLEERKIPYAIMRRDMTSQEYAALVGWYLVKWRKKK